MLSCCPSAVPICSVGLCVCEPVCVTAGLYEGHDEDSACERSSCEEFSLNSRNIHHHGHRTQGAIWDHHMYWTSEGKNANFVLCRWDEHWIISNEYEFSVHFMLCYDSRVVALAGPEKAISHSHPQANQQIFIAPLQIKIYVRSCKHSYLHSINYNVSVKSENESSVIQYVHLLWKLTDPKLTWIFGQSSQVSWHRLKIALALVWPSGDLVKLSKLNSPKWPYWPICIIHSLKACPVEKSTIEECGDLDGEIERKGKSGIPFALLFSHKIGP